MSSRRFSKSRRTALAGGAALVLGGAAVATVRAQQRPQVEPVAREDVLFLEGPLHERRDAWLKAVADKLGVTPERLDQAIQEASKEVGMPMPLLVPPPNLGIGEPGEPGTFSIRIDSDLATAAKAMGLTEEQLRKEAVSKSLTDVAKAHSVDPNAVADALKAQRRADIDKAVADGKLPATFAERLKSHIDDEIERLMRLPGFRGNFIFRFERAER
jgi:hypothetical protein